MRTAAGGKRVHVQVGVQEAPALVPRGNAVLVAQAADNGAQPSRPCVALVELLMRTAAEFREMAEMARVEFALGASDEAEQWDRVADALREAAELRAWMQLIYDFDDGAWAAGRHREAARKQGTQTMRGMAGRALRGEPVGGTDG